MKSIFCFLLSVIAVTFSFEHANEENLRKSFKVIKSYVDSITPEVELPTRSLCQQYTCCNLSSTESCDLDTLTRDKSVLIVPEASTGAQCIFETSTEYAFQVIPGDSDKVLVFYQGGGACWDQASTTAGLCTTSVTPTSFNGIFDRTNLENRYKDYTIVNALYCSGDVWGGNITQPYEVKNSPVVQVGLTNAQVTLDWIKEQQQKGQLSSIFSELVVSGSSAGSIGAQLHATNVLSSLSWEVASVVPDSYAGAFPDGTQGPLVYSFGLCTWNNFPPSLYDACNDQTITIQDLNEYYQKVFPTVPWAFIQSKTDTVQQAFYIAVGVTVGGNSSAFIDPTLFYEDVITIFGDYSKYNPNFVTYLVDGNQHEFTYKTSFYTADGLGPSDNDSQDNTDEVMSLWMFHHPLSSGEKTNSVCVGSSTVTKDNTYCSSAIIPKEFYAA